MIDIIIPLYNGHAYLDKALISIEKQTIKDKIKVTIVNDGSIKGYNDIIKKYNLNIVEIDLKKNIGAGNARNKGIKNTNYKYIMFMDQDDELYDENSVEILYNAIEEDETLDFIEGDLEITKNDDKKKENIFLHGRLYKRQFLLDNKIMFYNRVLVEDLLFQLTVLFKDAKYKKIDKKVYIYHNDIPTSITNINKYRPSYSLKMKTINYKYTLKNYKNINRVRKYTTMLFATYYYDYLNSNIKDNNEKILYLKMCKKFYNKYKKYIKKDKYINDFISFLNDY